MSKNKYWHTYCLCCRINERITDTAMARLKELGLNFLKAAIRESWGPPSLLFQQVFFIVELGRYDYKAKRILNIKLALECNNRE